MSEDDIHLHSRLLKRMTRCIFNCSGFTDSQKDDLAFICNINPYTMNPPLAPYADQWYVLKTIGSKPGAQEDVIKVSRYHLLQVPGVLIESSTTSLLFARLQLPWIWLLLLNAAICLNAAWLLSLATLTSNIRPMSSPGLSPRLPVSSGVLSTPFSANLSLASSGFCGAG